MADDFMKSIRGFTIIEVLVVVAITVIIAAAVTPMMLPVVESIQLMTTTNGIKHQLICAKTRALNDSRVHCGVYFDTHAESHRVQVFIDNGSPENNGVYDEGSDQLFMPAYILPPAISLAIGGAGSGSEIIFRGDGSTKVHGLIITVKTVRNREKRISVLPSTGRIKIIG